MRAEQATRRELVLALAATNLFLLRDARAEKTKVPVIGFLHESAPGPAAPYLAAFKQGLREAGYVDGQDLTIDAQCLFGQYQRF